jgi:hypothetical protein
MASTAEPLVTLRRHAGNAPWSLAELAALTDRLLGAAGALPAKPTTDRTVRFYVTRAVVQGPFGRGPGSAWGYPHLIELLAARLAQRDGETLDAIAERRATLTPAALERHTADRLAVPLPAPAEPVTESVAPSSATWQRFAVSPGVELHLHHDHPLLRVPGQLAVLLDGLRAETAPSPKES